MEQNEPPSAESAGKDEQSERFPDERCLDIGSFALSRRLLTEVTEALARFIEALPEAIDCDREWEEGGIPEGIVRDLRRNKKIEVIGRHLREGTLLKGSDFDIL